MHLLFGAEASAAKARHRTVVMQRIPLLFSLVVVCLVTAAPAQSQSPKPNPEFQKLHLLLGQWTCEGEYKPTPLGPGTRIKGEYTYRLILRGFGVEGDSVEKYAGGETRFLEIDAYDPARKNISMNVYGDDGSRYSGTITVSGNIITWEGKVTGGGKEFLFRQPFVLSSDGMSATAKGDMSLDGKSWIPFFEGKFTKVQPAVNE
jgi:hypothetical protein